MSAATADSPRATEPRRLLTGLRPDRALTLDEHLRLHGPLRGLELVARLRASGLTGRGGGGFPTARKLEAVLASGAKATVVVNGCEGEPVSGKDKVLLRHVPHLVLDGAAALASVLGTREIVVALEHTSTVEAAVVERAIREREEQGPFAYTLARVPRGFVSGEETAVVQFLGGGPAKPTLKPPLPAERGILVQNAETLAHVALAARNLTPSTRLFTVSGAVARPGVLELDAAATVDDVVAAAGGLSATPQAVLVGGYFGTWVAADQARRAQASGAGAVFVLPDGACGLYETARVAHYLAAESADQCGPCVHGLAAVAGGLDDLLQGRRVPRLERWLEQIPGRGACRHPDGAVGFVASALRVFGADHRHCRRRHAGLLPTPGMHQA